MSAARLRDLGGADPYETLGVSRTSGEEEILAAYKRRMRAAHPDRATGGEQFAKLLNVAKDILLDPKLRSAYDRSVADPDAGENIGGDPLGESAWDGEDVTSGASDSPFSSGRQSRWDAPPPPAAPTNRPPPAWPPTATMPSGAAPIWGPEHHRQGWEGAAGLLRYLAAGNPLTPLQGTTLVLGPGELPYADTALEYARFYAMNVAYNKTTVIGFGSLPFMAATLAGSAIANSVARSRAQAMAAQQWREIQIGRVVLTDRRFLANAGGRWLSFYHEAIVEFLPSAENFALVLSFQDSEPLRLRGPAVPWVSVALGSLLYPVETLFQIPGLAALRVVPPPGALDQASN